MAKALNGFDSSFTLPHASWGGRACVLRKFSWSRWNQSFPSKSSGLRERTLGKRMIWIILDSLLVVSILEGGKPTVEKLVTSQNRVTDEISTSKRSRSYECWTNLWLYQVKAFNGVGPVARVLPIVLLSPSSDEMLRHFLQSKFGSRLKIRSSFSTRHPPLVMIRIVRS